MKATGTAPLSYVWLKDGVLLEDQTNTSLRLLSVQAADAGDYTVVVTNMVGAITSQVATLTVLVPPTITGEPVSFTVVVGQPASFNLVAEGTAPLNYRWQKDGADLAGQDQATLTVVNARASDAGDYRVVVTNAAGSATSQVASLTVLLPPTIIQQPADQIVLLSSNATFSVTASGTPPFGYQWQKDGVPLEGQNAAGFEIQAMQFSDAGGYLVVVSNVAGVITSDVATLAVVTRPGITEQPVSQSVVVSQAVTLTVMATGTMPLTYQWLFNGNALPGATNGQLELTHVQPNQAGSYSVTVANTYGTITSDTVVLTVLEPPVFGAGTPFTGMVSWWPAEGNAQDVVGAHHGTANGVGFGAGMVGQGFSFDGIDDSVIGSAVGALQDNFSIEFWALPTASRDVTSESDSGITGTSRQRYAIYPQYALGYGLPGVCMGISVGCNGISVFEHTAGHLPSLLVYEATITNWTHIAVVCHNKQPTLYVNGAFARMGLTSQRSHIYPSGSFGSDAQTPGYGYYAGLLDEISIFDRILSADEVSRICAAGSSGKNPSGQPRDQTVRLGDNVTLTVVAQGTEPLSYQWLKDGVVLNDQTNALLHLSSMQVADAGGYSVVVTNLVGAITSRVATLTVLVPPTITCEPIGQTVVKGEPVSFSVVAEGTAPLSYRWQKDGVDLAGQNQAALTLANVQAADAGEYRVVVANAAGSATSQVATLAVLLPSTITQQPANQIVLLSSNASFTVSASGTAPLAYQWQKDGVPLDGQTSADLNLAAVQFSDAGGYAVVVSNVAGVITSEVATLTVVTRPEITEQPLSQGIVVSQSVTFTVEATGTVPLSYQWFFNGNALPGATSPQLVLQNVQPNQGGSYSVTVTNGYGSVTSDVAVLTVLEPPSFMNRAALTGMVNWWPAEGNGHDVVGAHDGTLVGTGFGAGMVGQGFIFDGVDDAVISAPLSAFSDTFTVEFWAFPTGSRTTTPESVSGASGTSGQRYAVYPQYAPAYRLDGVCAGVSVAVNGVSVFEHAGGHLPSPLVYDVEINNWVHIAVVYQNKQPRLYVNGVLARIGLTSQQSHVYPSASFGSDAQTPGYGYYAGLLDEISIFNRALLADEIAMIYAARSYGKNGSGEPVSRTVRVGENVMFDSLASGTGPLSFQWLKDGNALDGQTNTSLQLLSVQAADAGSYTVVVTNIVAAITSRVATLTVQAWLRVQTNGAGAVSWNPNGAVFPAGSPVTLTCTPDVDHDFTHWSGDTEGTNNPLTLMMDRDRSVTAHFVPTYTVAATSAGHGTAAVSPATARHRQGAVVELQACPDRWHAFLCWSDGITSNPRAIIVESNSVFTASFAPTEALETLEFGGITRLAPVGMPAVFVDGVFMTNESVQVRGSAQVTMQSTFPNATILYSDRGTDPTISGLLYTGQFRVDRISTLRAVAYPADFSKAVQSDPLDIVVLPVLTTVTDGGGSTSIDPSSGSYYSNALAVITARPAAGWTFLQWLGDVNGTGATVSVTVNRDKKAKAVFGTTLATTVVGSGTVLKDPNTPLIPYGHQVRLVAVPQAGNYFAFWGNAATGTDNPLMFTVTNANPVITAVFASLGASADFALTVIPVGRGRVVTDPPGTRLSWGTNIVLTAIPDAGQQFLGWTGDAEGTANPLTIPMDDSKVITATFTRRPVLELGGILGAMTRDGYRLSLKGEFGGCYLIKYSEDLSTWSTLAELTNSFGTVQFTDGAATNGAQRFYRARENSEP